MIKRIEFWIYPSSSSSVQENNRTVLLTIIKLNRVYIAINKLPVLAARAQQQRAGAFPALLVSPFSSETKLQNARVFMMLVMWAFSTCVLFFFPRSSLHDLF